jgi:anti-anti-sigma regulatory factor
MKNRTLEILKPKKGESVKAILYVDDELSFINAAQIKDDILKQIDKFDQLIIQANLVHIDLTGVQLLYSIRNSLKILNKQVTYNIKMNEELRDLIIRTGFKEVSNFA